jgi:hypothetical protein
MGFGPAEAEVPDESRCRIDAGTVWLPTVMAACFHGLQEQLAAGTWAVGVDGWGGPYSKDRLIIK